MDQTSYKKESVCQFIVTLVGHSVPWYVGDVWRLGLSGCLCIFWEVFRHEPHEGWQKTVFRL